MFWRLSGLCVLLVALVVLALLSPEVLSEADLTPRNALDRNVGVDFTNHELVRLKRFESTLGQPQQPLGGPSYLPPLPKEPPETQLKVLTLNCWDLKYVSKDRAERISAIAEVLLSRDHDIVSLQELWVYADYEFIKAAVADRLPYSKFYLSGALGAGLAIFSRFPYIETSITPYSLNGEPTDVIAGDWFVGKAAAGMVILHPVLGELEILNTHVRLSFLVRMLYAKGGDGGLVYERAHRLIGAWELGKLARQAASKGRYLIVAGDFNSIPTAVPLRIIRDHGGLSDSWLDLHPDTCEPYDDDEDWPGDEGEDIPRPILVKLLHRYGITTDTPLNTYTAGKPIDTETRQFGGKRIDYILYRQADRPPWASEQQLMRFPELRPVNSNVILTENVPGFAFSYSDHFALETTFEFEPKSSYLTPLHHATCNDTKLHLTTTIGSGLSIEDTNQALSNLRIRYDYADHRSTGELKVFGLSILLLLGLLIGSTQVEGSWLNLLLVVLTIYMAWLATTLLYEGFLYGNWEMRALRTVIADMELHRARMPY